MNSITLSEKEVKYLKSLSLPKYRKQEGVFLVEGPHLVKEAQELGLLVKAYTINPQCEGILITEASMKKISTTASVIQSIGVVKAFEKSELVDKLLILDAIQDPGNMGTLLRTAKSFGFETIVLGDGCCDIYNEKVIRSCQGAILKLNFVKTNIIDFMNKHPEYAYYGTDVKTGVSVETLHKASRFGLILGNEGNGLAENIKKLCQQNIYIPLEDMESLNVGVAGGILMYLLK